MVFGESFNENGTNLPQNTIPTANNNNITINDLYFQTQQIQNQVNIISANLNHINNTVKHV